MTFIPPYSSAPVKLDSTQSKVIAGENILKGDALCLTQSGKEVTVSHSGSTWADYLYGDKHLSQSFLSSSTTLIELALPLRRLGNPAGDFIVAIYACDANDKPTGVSLGTASIVASTVDTDTKDCTFIFNASVALTKYCAVARLPDGSSGNTIYWQGTNLFNYSDGKQAVSHDGGNTWTTSDTLDFGFKIYNQATQVLKADASDENKLGFIGFARKDAFAGSLVPFDSSGVTSSLSGLSKGYEYFLSDTPGEISTTQGSNRVKVGRALSETSLLIDRIDEQTVIQNDFIAREEINKGDALYLTQDPETEIVSQASENNVRTVSSNEWHSQSFTLPSNIDTITKISVKLRRVNTLTTPLIFKLFSASGEYPTGLPLATMTINNSYLPTSSQLFDFILDNHLKTTPENKLVFSLESMEDWSSTGAYTEVSYGSNSSYSGGKKGYSNDQATWGNETPIENGDLIFSVYGYNSDNSGAFKTQANNADKLDFIGFSNSNCSIGESVQLDLAGISDTQSRLIMGRKYYLSDTAGSISTSAGTNSVKIGTAITENKILIQHN